MNNGGAGTPSIFARSLFAHHEEPSTVFGQRRVYANERNCLNCVHKTICWGPGPVNPITPPNFALRSSWDVRDKEPYFMGVYGQVCGRFEHPDTHINQSMLEAEVKRFKAAKGDDWEA